MYGGGEWYVGAHGFMPGPRPYPWGDNSAYNNYWAAKSTHTPAVYAKNESSRPSNSLISRVSKCQILCLAGGLIGAAATITMSVFAAKIDDGFLRGIMILGAAGAGSISLPLLGIGMFSHCGRKEKDEEDKVG